MRRDVVFVLLYSVIRDNERAFNDRDISVPFSSCSRFEFSACCCGLWDVDSFDIPEPKQNLLFTCWTLWHWNLALMLWHHFGKNGHGYGSAVKNRVWLIHLVCYIIIDALVSNLSANLQTKYILLWSCFKFVPVVNVVRYFCHIMVSWRNGLYIKLRRNLLGAVQYVDILDQYRVCNQLCWFIAAQNVLINFEILILIIIKIILVLNINDFLRKLWFWY